MNTTSVDFRSHSQCEQFHRSQSDADCGTGPVTGLNRSRVKEHLLSFTDLENVARLKERPSVCGVSCAADDRRSSSKETG